MFGSKRRFVLAAAAALAAAVVLASLGLQSPVTVVYSANRVPTIKASNELDAIYMQGYLHAKDRFFQMDVQRRLFSGTLSELVGPAGIPQDVQLRTLGLKRAAERSLPLQTPETMEWLNAYADGVNAYLQGTLHGNIDEDSCSLGGDSSDSSGDGHSLDSSDDRSTSSGDSGTGNVNILDPLPPEYAALETDRDGIPLWTPLDSLIMVKGLSFGLSFDLEDIDRTIALLTFRAVEPFLGIFGVQLYGTDLYPVTPFDSSISIPAGAAPPGMAPLTTLAAPTLSTPDTQAMLESYRTTVEEFPVLKNALDKDFSKQGSNWFIAAGSATDTGYPMIANDPHLALGTPATFYEAHIQVDNGINVTGISFPGAPGIVQGCNDTICWGSTVNPMDVTDVYQEVLLALGPDPTQPTHTFFQGAPEPIQFIPQQFNFNIIGDGNPNTLADAGVPAASGGVTLVVPRRNNGPIVEIRQPTAPGQPVTGFSVMYTGWSGTQELEAFRLFARAQSPQDFADALQYFDVGSQNWGYADINGNIAYYTSGELPIREDLQTLFFPDGLQPPTLIRDGTNTLKHEWLPVINPQPNQAVGYEILPFAEMPQIVNPANGLIINANNDPIGTTLDNVTWNGFRAGFNGRLYLSAGYAKGFRQGRLQRLIDDAVGNGPLTAQQFKDFQANNQLLDAEFFVPYIKTAFDNAVVSADPNLAALANDAGIAEAVARLDAWDFSTPTGIDEGWDPGDPVGVPGPASLDEIDASVAATIYSVWRGQFIQRVIDGTLASLPIPLNSQAPPSSTAVVAVQRLLLAYPVRQGAGLGLINFFTEPGAANQFDARDLIILRAVENSLALLASNDFAPAFANSINQDDYRWGKLHRIVFEHPLGGPFNIPPTGGPGNLAADLPGISRAGGFGAVDASAHNARSDGLNEFMFGSGPSRRMVATMAPTGPQVVEVIPGGQSGIPGSPYQTDQLDLWLVNAYHPLPLTMSDVLANSSVCQSFIPPPQGTTGAGPGPGESATVLYEPTLTSTDREAFRRSGRTPARRPQR